MKNKKLILAACLLMSSIGVMGGLNHEVRMANAVEAGTNFKLVTSADELETDCYYLIASMKTGSGKVMAGQNSNNRAAVDATVTSEDGSTVISYTSAMYSFKLGGDSENGYTFYDENNKGYLYAAGGTNKNYLKIQTDLTDAGKWEISLNDSATIKTKDSSVKGNIIKYNNDTKNGIIFSCYASTQQPVYLYKEVITEKVSVTFQYNNNQDDVIVSVNSGKKITQPKNPTKEGYKFLGWYNGETKWDFEKDVVTSDLTLTAKWKDLSDCYKVTFKKDTDDTDPTYEYLDNTNKEKITQPENPTKEGYKFLGWYNGETEWDFENNVVTRDLTLIAKWEVSKEITANMDFTNIDVFDSWSSYSKQDVEYDCGHVIFDSVIKQTQTITNMPVTKGQPVSFVANDGYTISSATLTLEQWTTKTQTVTLNTSVDGGTSYTSTSENSSDFVLKSNSIGEGVNAIKYTFSSQSNQVGIKSLVVTLVKNSDDSSGDSGEVAEKFNVTFQYNNNQANDIVSVESGNKITQPENPTKEDYKFLGWYNGETEWDFENDVVTSDLTLTAMWEVIKEIEDKDGTHISSRHDYLLYGDLYGVRFIGSINENYQDNISKFGFDFTLISGGTETVSTYESKKYYQTIDDSKDENVAFDGDDVATYKKEGYLSFGLLLKNIPSDFTGAIEYSAYVVIKHDDGTTTKYYTPTAQTYFYNGEYDNK